MGQFSDFINSTTASTKPTTSPVLDRIRNLGPDPVAERLNLDREEDNPFLKLLRGAGRVGQRAATASLNELAELAHLVSAAPVGGNISNTLRYIKTGGEVADPFLYLLKTKASEASREAGQELLDYTTSQGGDPLSIAIVDSVAKTAGQIADPTDLIPGGLALKAGRNIPSKAVGRAAREWLTTQGKFSVFDNQDTARRLASSEIDHLRQASAEERTAQIVGQAAGREVRRLARSTGEGEQMILAQISAAMEGHAPIETLPESLQPLVVRMRQHQDWLSMRSINEMGLPENLREVMASNIGKYQRREYMAYHDKKAWRQHLRDHPEIKQNAFNKLKDMHVYEDVPGEFVVDGMGNRHQLKRSPEEQAKMINEYLDELINNTPETVYDYFGGVDHPVLSEFRKRHNVPSEVRKFLGEIHDPIKQFEWGVKRLSHDIEVHKFLDELASAGIREGLFVPVNHPLAQSGQFSEIIHAVGPMRTLRTTPEVSSLISGIKTANGVPYGELQGLRGVLEKYRRSSLARYNSALKASRTVGNVTTHARNLESYIFMGALNGVFGTGLGRGTRKAIKNVKGAFASESNLIREIGEHVTLADGSVLADKAINLADRAYDYIRLGVWGKGARSADARHYTKESLKLLRKEDGNPAGFVRELIAKGVEDAGTLYTKEDDLGRTIIFEKYYHDLMWALHGQKTSDEIMVMAADRLNKTTPTMGANPEIVGLIRDFPVLGMYPSFYAQIPVNVANSLKIGFEDIITGIRTGNENLRYLGEKRIGGLVTTMMAPAAALSAAGFTLGKTYDDIQETQEALRVLGPEWNRNGHLIPVSLDDGKVTYIDLSFTFPYGQFTELAVATLKDREWTATTQQKVFETAVDMFSTTLGPLLSREMIFEEFVDLFNGRTVNPDASVGTQAKQTLWHLSKNLLPIPGTFWQGKRLAKSAGIAHESNRTKYGRELTPGTEALALIGPRLEVVDPVDSMKWNARNWRFTELNVRRIYTSVNRDPNSTPEEKLESRREAARRFKEEQATLMNQIRAAQTLLMQMGDDEATARKKIFDALIEDQKISKKRARAFLDGRYIPLNFEED